MELRRAGLTANPRKCHLGLSEAKYLGFQVGRGPRKPQEKKVEAVQSSPKPSTKSQVRAVLGLAGYYRCFIPNFSSLAAPLTDLTRKGQPEKVCWTPEAEEALRRVKMALSSEPVLRAPDFSCPFLLQTDASDTGLGAVLSQVQEGEEHPILYISRKLTPAKENYATVEKEALAIKWRSWSCATTSWAGGSPSLRTTHPSNGWPGRRTQTSTARIHPHLDTTESTATSQNGITTHALTHGLIKSTIRGFDLSSPCHVFLPPRYSHIHNYTKYNQQ